jgi:hypothetical protein
LDFVGEGKACMCFVRIKVVFSNKGSKKASHKTSCAPCMGLLIYPIGALKKEKPQLNAYGIMVTNPKS